MKITLMGLEFFINNLGCEALAYSFVSELYDIAKKRGESLDISTIVFADRGTPHIPETDIPIRCIGIHYKSLPFWKEIIKEFKACDYIFDFTMGDSFSDIYGIKRFVLDALVKTVAIKSGTPYILGPQTYGPYNRSLVKKWARWIMKKASFIYTRDGQSKKLAAELTGRDIFLTTDVAFALPYEHKVMEKTDKVRVGFNPSGLLWSGGYTRNNQFGLTLDYRKYCQNILEKLCYNDKYEVYLIPHVGTNSKFEDDCENDSAVCRLLHDRFTNTKIVDEIMTPMDAKGYIAAMDVFIGARMHATIGAFSSGVATIPVSYSRKFEGLFGSLQYDYVIHALQDSTEDAVKKTIQYVEEFLVLKSKIETSMEIVNDKQKLFMDSLIKDVFQ